MTPPDPKLKTLVAILAGGKGGGSVGWLRRRRLRRAHLRRQAYSVRKSPAAGGFSSSESPPVAPPGSTVATELWRWLGVLLHPPRQRLRLRPHLDASLPEPLEQPQEIKICMASEDDLRQGCFVHEDETAEHHDLDATLEHSTTSRCHNMDSEKVITSTHGSDEMEFKPYVGHHQKKQRTYQNCFQKGHYRNSCKNPPATKPPSEDSVDDGDDDTGDSGKSET